MSRSKDFTGTNHVFVDVPIRVRYADTDKMGVVYYGTYPVYFEIARSEYMREKGFTYKEFETHGYYLVVVEMAARYHGNAGYDDLLIVKTSIPELKSRSMTFRYEVYKDDVLLVEGHTTHYCINNDKKTVAIPGHLLQILKNARTE